MICRTLTGRTQFKKRKFLFFKLNKKQIILVETIQSYYNAVDGGSFSPPYVVWEKASKQDLIDLNILKDK